MTAHETPDELRARLSALAADALEATVRAMHSQLIPDLDCAAEADYRVRNALVNAWPAIAALLARLTAAEADADRGWAWADQCVNLDHLLPDSFVRFQVDGVLHDEAVALRERSS